MVLIVLMGMLMGLIVRMHFMFVSIVIMSVLTGMVVIVGVCFMFMSIVVMAVVIRMFVFIFITV